MRFAIRMSNADVHDATDACALGSVEQSFRVGECLRKSKMRRIVEPYPIGVDQNINTAQRFSSSCGSEKLYGNALTDPPNGLARRGDFVSVITSCRSASKRWAMYFPEKPKAPVTAIRTLAFHQADESCDNLRYLPPKIRTRPANYAFYLSRS